MSVLGLYICPSISTVKYKTSIFHFAASSNVSPAVESVIIFYFSHIATSSFAYFILL